jgi:C1A family cysteine protease
MRAFCIIIVLVASASAFNATTFDAYLTQFSKSYSGAEYKQRFSAYLENDRIIEEHNAKISTFKLGHNQFSDLTITEFTAQYLSTPMPPKHPSSSVLRADNNSVFADSIDWSTKGAVTPVKNQAKCGSCWAFSTTGGLEGAYFLKNNKLTSFSEQQLVSCNAATDHGCGGGLMDNAFEWIETQKGLCTEGDYPYTSGGGVSGTCINTCNPVPLSGMKHTDVEKGSMSAMMTAVTGQPVSIAIQANQPSFQLYASGVITGLCGTQLDHGVLAVGYGTVSGTDYWKVKNSWDTSW